MHIYPIPFHHWWNYFHCACGCLWRMREIIFPMGVFGVIAVNSLWRSCDELDVSCKTDFSNLLRSLGEWGIERKVPQVEGQKIILFPFFCPLNLSISNSHCHLFPNTFLVSLHHADSLFLPWVLFHHLFYTNMIIWRSIRWEGVKAMNGGRTLDIIVKSKNIQHILQPYW